MTGRFKSSQNTKDETEQHRTNRRKKVRWTTSLTKIVGISYATGDISLNKKTYGEEQFYAQYVHSNTGEASCVDLAKWTQ